MSKRILILLLMISLVILTFCTKKSTSPEEKLLPPSNLQITLVGENQIKLTWKDNSTNETKFLIDRKEGEFDWYENYGDLDANITSFIDEISTNSDTVYSYKIRAFDGKIYSDYSIPTGWFADGTAPTNLQLEEIAQYNIKLTWQDNSIGELCFYIDRKISNGDWVENYKEVSNNITNFYDYNDTAYDTCFYRVSAASGNSSSQYSENNLVSYYFTPQHFEATKIALTEIKLSWEDSCNFEDGFKIDRKKGGGEWEVEHIILQSNIKEFVDEVDEFGTYFYRLYAFANSYNSAILETCVFSIQYFIDNAQNGETIIVPDGIYYETIIIEDKTISLLSENGAEGCIIDGSVLDNYIRISGVSNSSTISGFTFQNIKYCGIVTDDSSPTISNNKICFNGSNYYGAGIEIRNGNTIVKNNIICDNVGFGIKISGHYGVSQIINNTIISTSTGIGKSFSGSPTPTVIIMNNIIWGNEDYCIYFNDGTEVIVTYSNIDENYNAVNPPGEGCIYSNPEFINQSIGDLHLHSLSPCINTGNPNPIYNDPDGSRNDMGAYGGPGGDW